MIGKQRETIPPFSRKKTPERDVVEDPTVRNYIQDFQELLDALKSSEGKEYRNFAKKTESLSGDIVSQLGSPMHAPLETVKKIIHLFRAAADCICVPPNDDSIARVRANIIDRADSLAKHL